MLLVSGTYSGTYVQTDLTDTGSARVWYCYDNDKIIRDVGDGTQWVLTYADDAAGDAWQNMVLHYYTSEYNENPWDAEWATVGWESNNDPMTITVLE